MAQNYLVKIIPPRGYHVHRIEFTRTHLVVAIAVCTVLVASLVAYCLGSVIAAQSRVRELRTVDDTQQQQLSHMSSRAEAIGREIRQLQVQNQQIRRLMGAEPPGLRSAGPAAPAVQQQSARPQGFDRVADGTPSLRSESPPNENVLSETTV